MYEIVKNVIRAGEYDLAALLLKIDTLWVRGSLTDAEQEELKAMARSGAHASGSVDVLRKLQELDARVAKLEGGVSEIQDYTPGKWYYTGNRVLFDGTAYTCTAPEGVVCVWSPAEYPGYWQAEA